jgi:hypothetical protein
MASGKVGLGTAPGADEVEVEPGAVDALGSAVPIDAGKLALLAAT